MMENNETGVKVPKGQINLNTVLGAIGTAGALGVAGNWFGGSNGNCGKMVIMVVMKMLLYVKVSSIMLKL